MSPMEVLIATTMTNAEIVAQNDPGSIETVGRSAVGRWQSTGRPVRSWRTARASTW